MTCAIGMTKLVQAVPFLQSFGLFVPYISVCMASAGNMAFTRMEEIKTGIPVYSESGEMLGKSPIAVFIKHSVLNGRSRPFKTLCFINRISLKFIHLDKSLGSLKF